jgi:hypothetical protein
LLNQGSVARIDQARELAAAPSRFEGHSDLER